MPRKRIEKTIISELKESILTRENVEYVYKKLEKLIARGLNEVPELARKKKQQYEKLMAEIRNYLNFVKVGNFSKAVSGALKEAERKSDDLKEEIKSLEFQKENAFQSPPKEWIDHRLRHLHETLSKNTVSSALALKGILGTIQLEPISDEESDFYQIINGDKKKFKPYYIAHTKIQTLALLDERHKSSNWLHWRTRSQPIRTFGEITAYIKILPVHQPYLYQKLSQKATQLRLLGMSYQQIAKGLNTNKKTAMKACKYKRRKLYVLVRHFPVIAKSVSDEAIPKRV